MTIVSVRRVQIQLGHTPLSVYCVTYADGVVKDLLAGRNVTDAIEKHHSSLAEKHKVKSLRSLPNADPSLTELKADTGESFTPVSIKDACFYWGQMSQAKNEKATSLLVACAVESIETRVNLQIQKEDEMDEELAEELDFTMEVINDDFQNTADIFEEWFTVRDNARQVHKFFQSECKRHHYPAHKVHDLLTLGIFGNTAEAARMKDLVSDDLDPTVGLNHQEDIFGMRILALAKDKFAGYRKGTWQEKVKRAVSEAKKVS